ncbi:hypothetical protein [Xanthomonas graminis]|uniref:hypothetical protein n=1 Tax=Xanthomonas graminis TaxID=3390026 RepID=UPI001BAF4957|nr:hypothetical protein [Xanthomonas translucens]
MNFIAIRRGQVGEHRRRGRQRRAKVCARGGAAASGASPDARKAFPSARRCRGCSDYRTRAMSWLAGAAQEAWRGDRRPEPLWKGLQYRRLPGGQAHGSARRG